MTTAEIAECKVLDEEYHHQLLQAWPKLAEHANVSVHWIKESCREWIGPQAQDYMLNWKENGETGHGGFVLAPSKRLPEQRCSVMAAALFRVYHTARVMHRDDVLSAMAGDGVPDIPMILVPDFYVGGYQLTDKQSALLYRFLSSQALHSKNTVLYVENPLKLREVYGDAIYDHLAQTYVFEKK